MKAKDTRAVILVRLDPELKRKVEALADYDDRSVNTWVIQLIKKAIEEKSQ